MTRFFNYSIHILSSLSLLYISNTAAITEREEKAISVAERLAKASQTPAQEFRNYIVKYNYNATEIQAIADDLKKIGYTININPKENAVGIEFVSKRSLTSKDASSQQSTENFSNRIVPVLKGIEAKVEKNGNDLKGINNEINKLGKKQDNQGQRIDVLKDKLEVIKDQIQTSPNGANSCPTPCKALGTVTDELNNVNKQMKDLSDNIQTLKEDITEMKNVLAHIPATHLENLSLSNKDSDITNTNNENDKTDKTKEDQSLNTLPKKSLEISGKDAKFTSIDTNVEDIKYTITTQNEFLKRIIEDVRELYPDMSDGAIINTICNDLLALSKQKISTYEDNNKLDLLDYIKHLAELRKKYKKASLSGLCKQDLALNRLKLEANGDFLPTHVNQFENAANDELYTAWLEKKDVNKIRNEAIAELKDIAVKHESALNIIFKCFKERNMIYDSNAECLYEILNIYSQFKPFITKLCNKYGTEYSTADLIEKYITDEHIILRNDDYTFERLIGKYDTGDNYEKIAKRQAEERKAELEKIRTEKSGNTKNLVNKHTSKINGETKNAENKNTSKPTRKIVKTMVNAYDKNKTDKNMNGIIKKTSKRSAYDKIGRQLAKK